MDQAQLEQAVAGLPLAEIRYFESVGSTNDVAAEWARQGKDGICLAVADEQTRGRGRSGRRWFTPPDAALAFSLLLDASPKTGPGLGRITGLGALAVCEALEALYALSPQIKWPNDILLGGKKVCGILAEAHWSGERLGALVLGIGINVAASSVPPQAGLNFQAVCLEDFTGKEVRRLDLLKAVIEHLLIWKQRLEHPGFTAAWESRLAYRGQTVQVETGPGKRIEAELLGLAEDGQLKLRLPNGAAQVFAAGEIRISPRIDSQAA